MESINILILSAGRRVELVKAFKEAAKSLNINSKVITVDISDTAPAMYFSDKRYLIPRINDKNYLKTIIGICNSENINLIVPTIDTELLVMADNKEKIEAETNAKVLISDIRVIEICRDKIKTSKFFEENGFGVPREITKKQIEQKEYTFPLFIKPLDGSSSVNAFRIEDLKQLEFFLEYVKKPIVQQFIEGTEYTVDVLLDFESNPITIVPRQRLATRSGEISKGLIKKDREIIEEVKKLLKVLKPVGHITIQCMKTSEGIKFIEINPRFGGGAPMSIKAGANSPINLYRLLSGEKIQYNEDYQDNMLGVRFDETIYLNENMELYND